MITHTLPPFKKVQFYIVVLFIVSFTFQNFLKYTPYVKFGIILFSIILYIYSIRQLPRILLVSLLTLSLLIAVQGIMFGYSLLSHFTSAFFNIFLIFVLLRILPINYHKYLINVIFFLTLTSLLFWGISNISESFHNKIPEIAEKYNLDPINLDNPSMGSYEQIILFTYEKARIYGVIRNAGFSHEPGAFAVALIYALVFNTMLTSKYLSLKNIVFIFAIITTFSTAGYAALYIFLLSSYFQQRGSVLLKTIGVVLGLSLTIYTFIEIEFMSSKIQDYYSTESQMNLNEETSGRFFGARKALVVLTKYPITGRGFTTASNVKDLSSEEAAGYGIMAFISSVGIPISIIILILFYKTISFWAKKHSFSKNKTLLLAFSFMPVLFAQSFIPSVLFNLIIFETAFRRYSPNSNIHNTTQLKKND